jgi:membrane protein
MGEDESTASAQATATGDPEQVTTLSDAGDGRASEGPHLGPSISRWRVLRWTFTEFRNDNLTTWAAALTYYGVLALFPALIAVVSILGLIGHSVTQPLLNNLDRLAPGSVRSILASALHNLQHSRGTAGVLVIAGIAGALWSASGYISAFMQASNAVYDVREGRSIWMRLPIRLAVTVVMLALLAISAIAVVVTGALAGQVGKLLGIGGTVVTVWDVAKWPVLLLVVSFMFSILYWASPNVKQGGFHWISPGSVFAVTVWVIASGAFALYVANFSSYNKTYGTLTGAVIFLVWLWISNVALLLGAELNAEIERAHHIEAGHPPDEEPFVELRRSPKESREQVAEDSLDQAPSEHDSQAPASRTD